MNRTIRIITIGLLGSTALAPTAFAQGGASDSDVPDDVPLDQIIADDLIVEGRICSSDQSNCADGEDFLNYGPTGFQLEYKAKDNSPAIGFDTTLASAARWVIGSNGNDDLRFEYDDTADSGLVMAMRVPGLVGVNELNPQAPLHVVGADGVVDPTETVFIIESTASPQQIFDNTTTGAEWFFAMTSDDQFKISRNGTGKVEAKFFDTGNLQIAGTLIQGSDAANKRNFETIDPASVLDTVVALPITEWNYVGDDARHIGPTAQDFAAAFGLGGTETGISAIDADGVALAAIQALAVENDELRAQVEALAESSAGGGSMSWTLLIAVALGATMVMVVLGDRAPRLRRARQNAAA